MKLSLGVVFVVLIAASFVAMMNVKNGVRDMRGQSQALLERRGALAESARVLEAEREFLSRPQRLEAFAREKGLREIHYRQMVELPQLVQAHRQHEER